LEHPQITQVVLCLDNDETGQKASNQLRSTLERIRDGYQIEYIDTNTQELLRRVYDVSILKSKLKDWNDDVKRL
jgi:hypothetical protein